MPMPIRRNLWSSLSSQNENIMYVETLSLGIRSWWVDVQVCVSVVVVFFLLFLCFTSFLLPLFFCSFVLASSGFSFSSRSFVICLLVLVVFLRHTDISLSTTKRSNDQTSKRSNNPTTRVLMCKFSVCCFVIVFTSLLFPSFLLFSLGLVWFFISHLALSLFKYCW